MPGPERHNNPYLRHGGALEGDAPGEGGGAREELARREAGSGLEVEIVDRSRGARSGPVAPVRLTFSDRFGFSCHKGISCWNACCRDTDITLTPFDILKLSRTLDLRPAEFLRRFAVSAIWERADLPVAKLRVADEEGGHKPCVFLDDEEGCTVYDDRPVACRYYPLGLAAVKLKGHEAPEDFYFLVEEDHCRGHAEPKQQSVAEFRAEQGVEPYDLQNRGWIEILMKMTSWKTLGGPNGKAPGERTKQMFFMATTDVDAFRRFVFETSFLESYDVDPALAGRLGSDDEALMRFAFDWLKHILFNEAAVALRRDVLQRAVARARRDMGAG